MAEKTIKQIADEYQVSKQAIRQRINKLSSDCYQVGSNNTIYVNEKGLKILESQLSSKVSSNGVKVGSKVDTKQVSSNLDSVIAMLQKELEIKNKQIDEKDKQISDLIASHNKDKENASREISELHHLLGREQELLKQANDKILLLESQEPAEEHTKKHWWSWSK